MKPTVFHNAGVTLSGAEILRDLSFALNPGEWTFLVGPPGAGKTTLLRLAADEIAPTAGRIDRAGAAVLAHHSMPLDDAKSSCDIVAEVMSEPNARVRAEDLLTDLGLETYLGHEPFRLSRGHRARLVIARGIAARPALLCLDDPFSPMDRRAKMLTANALARAADEDELAILMASNDPLDALRYADRILVLSAGPGATVVETIAHAPTPDASDDDLAKTGLHARLWRALDG
ncbi:MAG TPA: ATP-binding cassette domain-containing protein [Rhodoblastus sp.]|nr:ATP-binding cassette domain-containing protein [Rhodoblastus sp.]